MLGYRGPTGGLWWVVQPSLYGFAEPGSGTLGGRCNEEGFVLGLHTHEQKIFRALSCETSKSTQKQNETEEVNDLHKSANSPPEDVF